MTEPITLPDLVDLPTIARHLGVTPRHVRRLVAERRIPFVKWGHLLRFDPAEIAAWLDTARVGGHSPTDTIAPTGQLFGSPFGAHHSAPRRARH